MLGSVLAQLVRWETSLKWPRALLQISPSALGIQFGSRARRYNISRARRSVKKISDYTNSTLLILLRPLISFYLVAFDFYYGKEKSNLIFNHGPLKSDSSYKT